MECSRVQFPLSVFKKKLEKVSKAEERWWGVWEVCKKKGCVCVERCVCMYKERVRDLESDFLIGQLSLLQPMLYPLSSRNTMFLKVCQNFSKVTALVACTPQRHRMLTFENFGQTTSGSGRPFLHAPLRQSQA